MGYGPVVNGKQKPITPWKGSWAQLEQAKRELPHKSVVTPPLSRQYVVIATAQRGTQNGLDHHKGLSQ